MKIIALLLTLLLLTACAAQNASDPAETVERYLQAKITGDENALHDLLCLPMEADLPREVASFASVTDVKLENVDCQREGETDVVSCTGEIVAVYGTENTSFPLTSYRVVQEDGVWKWCGEAG